MLPRRSIVPYDPDIAGEHRADCGGAEHALAGRRVAVRCVDRDLDSRSARGPRSGGTPPPSFGPALAAGRPDAGGWQAVVPNREGRLPTPQGVAGAERAGPPGHAGCGDEPAHGLAAQPTAEPKGRIVVSR